MPLVSVCSEPCVACEARISDGCGQSAPANGITRPDSVQGAPCGRVMRFCRAFFVILGRVHASFQVEESQLINMLEGVSDTKKEAKITVCSLQ